MTTRSDHLLEILEHIGAPLMVAILQARAAAGLSHGDDIEQDAQRMAELLAKSVQAGIDIGQTLDLAVTGQSDALRVALTALAGRFVGAHYGFAAKIPGDADLKKMAAAMQAASAFTENFTLDEETLSRLKALRAPARQAHDTLQVHLQYIEALLPVINAINAFPFGQAEQKLIVDISGRLTQQAKTLRQTAFADSAAADHQRIELALVSVLAQIYAACHAAETKHIMSLKPDQRPSLTLGPVWEVFELRVALLEALAASITGRTGGQAKAATAADAKKPAAFVPPAAAQNQNPMSLFAKKPEKTGTEEAPESIPKEIELPPKAKETPPPAIPAQNDGKQNPMSFFKPGAKKDDAA